MKKPTEVLNIFEDYTKEVDSEIKALLNGQEDFEMYGMMSYFFGYKDENLAPTEVYGGKRFRSGLCLLLSDFYKSRGKALKVASAIEIFHNFTLIHDDIEDNDPLRRGRPTVWKLWGLNHGINSGDGQLILANIELVNGCQALRNGSEILEFLNKKFLEVAEGQFLDFSLTELPINDKNVDENNYLLMVKKKSSVLIGAATKAAGLIADLKEDEVELLWEYGLNLGFAYQLCDDLVSIWGDPEVTGKISYNDIREKKKTLPVIYLYNKLNEADKISFEKIYNKQEDLSEAEIEKVVALLDENGAYEYTWKKIEELRRKSIAAVEDLNLDEDKKEILKNINKALLPNIKEFSKC